MSEFNNLAKGSLDELDSVIRQWVHNFISDLSNVSMGVAPKIQDELMNLRKVRWYSIAKIDLDGLWKFHIKNEETEGELGEAMMDFYLNGTAFMFYKAALSTQAMSTLINHLGTALTWPHGSAYIPAEIREHMTSKEDLIKLLGNSPWLVFMVVLSMTDPFEFETIEQPSPKRVT